MFKEGHEFEVGQFPTDGSLFDFQEPVSSLEFIDSTKLRVIGRVIGGTREGDKVPGLGRSVNNIGKARVVFEALVGNGCHRDTVFTDSQTGEYVTQLYPLKYVVKDVRVTNPSQNISTSDFFDALPQIDLVNIGTELTVRDTIFTSGTTNVEQVDSMKYNYRQDFIYRKIAELEVLAEDRMMPFRGESTYLFEGNEEDQSFALGSLTYPVFERSRSYSAYINAFERYQNLDADAPVTEDKVPVTDGELEINNQLAGDGQQNKTIQLSDGDTIYTFIAGRPNFLVNNNRPEFNYTKTLDITLKRPGQTVDVKWEPNAGVALEDKIFRAYLVGFQQIVGSNFVTKGPQVVEMVIRDPYGDQSTASFTTASSFTINKSFEWGLETENKINTSVKAGAKQIVGLGTATTIEGGVETSTEFQFDVKTEGSRSLTETTSVSQTITTNGGDEAVGRRSDLYIGKSFNVNFGVTKILEFIPNDVCTEEGLTCADVDGASTFKIGQRTGFVISPDSSATQFVFDHNYIVNYLIPNLKRIRNQLFIDNPAIYVSKLDAGNENYGTNNDDKVWGIQASSTDPDATETADKNGPSYEWKGTGDYGLAEDSIRIYNQQIELWEDAIRQNEQDKVNAFQNTSPVVNFSFNGGTSIAREIETSSEASYEQSIEVALSKEFEQTLSTEVGGSGLGSTLNTTVKLTTKAGGSVGVSSSTKWAYELTDDDQGDFQTIDVFDSPRGWGPIFRTVAGQTSCPHEEGHKTLYYQPGTELSVRTLQRDKIGIDIFPKLVQNVPEGEAAVFNIQLQNLSETNDSREYAVRLDPNSNPDGLEVRMDGRSLSVVNEFALTGGSLLTKAISVRRGPEKYDYENVRLLVYVPCQYQAGTSDEIDLVDSVEFSVSFLPECTDIRVKEPTDLWVLNNFNQDTLPITIDNYDINKNGFESISLQYRPASEATWRELNKWWHPTNKPDEMGDQIPQNSSFIRYFWDMSSNVDGPYQLRAVSECELANKETDFKQGVADRINPTPFGTPSPGDGICDPGEDLKIRFNEMVDIGSLTSLNFDIRGVLNGTPLRNSESVAFDGVNDYMQIPAFDLTKRSFAVEFWAKLGAAGEGTVFSQGSSAGQGLFVGFDASSYFQFSFAGQTLTSMEVIPTDTWKHFVASFDFDSNTAKLFIDGVEKNVSNSFTAPYVSIGGIRVGQTQSDGSKPFNGNVHELRLWNTSRSTADIIPNLNISLSPTTTGLMGYWQMNEGVGNIAADRVRKRNGVLNGATWAISPVGRAFSFNGSSDYLEVNNVGTIVFTEETDMTIEMWFRGSSAGTLFSNGKGDGTDNETSWTIGLDASGKIVVNNNGAIFESNLGGYLDNDWHHISLVLERNSAIRLFVDTQLIKTGSSSIWKGFAGSKFWIGARGWFDGGTELKDQYFAGGIDDIRVWNLARRPEQIERDWVNRLLGDELGLIAYYPFEAYRLDAGVPVLDASLADQSINNYDLSQGGGTGLNYLTATPSIKLQRPVEKVNFTYIVNDDEIILTPTDPSSRLEHSTLDITVKGVKDVYGNVMQSPATWIAFMNKNQVNWDRSDITIAQEFRATGTFEAIIVNSGGSEEDFQILNLPSWLTASPSSGTLEPNSQLAVKFTISDNVNVGDYEQDIFLSTDFGFNERLTLNLTVKATPPDWTMNPSMFENSMSFVGQLLIEGVISTDTEDQLAAFVGEELRGVANVELDPLTNKYLVFLDVYSNQTSGEALEFRIWNASEGKVHLPVTPTDQTFALFEFVGTPETPQIFEAVSSIAQSYSLEAGWNWISFPLASSDLSDVNKILKFFNATENDRVLSQDYFDVYNDPDGWTGTLSAVGNGFNRKEGYKMFVAQAGTFTYSGTLGDPSSESIPLDAGWNWVGVIASKNVEINAALASLTPTDGDVIRGQRAFAVYEAGLGWTGSLDFLEPTQSYMIKLTNAGTLTYPTAGFAPNEAQLKAQDQLITLEANMNLQPRVFEHGMSMIATVNGCRDAIVGQNAYLAAFVGDESRGIAPIEWQGKQAIAYLTLHGTDKEQFTFSIIQGKQSQEIVLQEQITFHADELLGQLQAPFVLNVVENCNTKVIQDATVRQPLTAIAIYPNPFDQQLNIEFDLPHSEQIKVVLQDLNGRVVAEIFDGTLGAGQHKMNWESDYEHQLNAGIYFLNIQSDSVNHIEKVVR